MKRFTPLLHYYTAAEIADLFQQDPRIVDRMVRCSIHPDYVWKSKWREPRWHPDTLPEWMRIFDRIDLASLPTNPPPLTRPADEFSDRDQGPTEADLAIAARMCGLR